MWSGHSCPLQLKLMLNLMLMLGFHVGTDPLVRPATAKPSRVVPAATRRAEAGAGGSD